MGWLDRLLGRKAMDSGELARVLLRQTVTKSGAGVSLATALQVSAVAACSRVISEGVAQTPVKLFQKEGQGRQVADKEPLHRLITDQPNGWMTSFEMLEGMVMHAVLTGNAFALTTRSARGEVLEILPLLPHWVTVVRNEDWSLRYKVRLPGGQSQDFTQSEMWHFRGPSWDGVVGLDAVRNARESIGLSLAAEEYGASLFANGARPGGLLTTNQNLNLEQKAQLVDAWQKAHEGGGNAMKTAVLEGGLKYEQLAMTSTDAELIATRRHVTEEICRFMRVLPIMVGSTGEGAPTYASAEQMFLAHVVHTLTPWFVRMEQSMARHFLSPSQRQQGLYFKFLPNGLMRGAAADRAEFYAKALGAGGSPAWMTPDEIRALEELNPIGGDAATLPLPSAMQASGAANGA